MHYIPDEEIIALLNKIVDEKKLDSNTLNDIKLSIEALSVKNHPFKETARGMARSIIFRTLEISIAVPEKDEKAQKKSFEHDLSIRTKQIILELNRYSKFHELVAMFEEDLEKFKETFSNKHMSTEKLSKAIADYDNSRLKNYIKAVKDMGTNYDEDDLGVNKGRSK